ncbi:MAG: class I SAM-dependent methyltransferase [Myxococcales bacterium]|nr:class I SAM-dependent methyltransferase [Myxococcales bacterium]
MSAEGERCVVCGAARAEDAEEAMVRCNVRRFRDERFAVWRCAQCRSIHARDAVDLEHYYGGYPVFDAELDWKLRVVYGAMLGRLREAGLGPEHELLDYGCGKGLLLSFLREQGQEHVSGYDRFAEGYDDPQVLGRSYDFIVTQDLIEHVADPHTELKLFDSLLRPGGLISIGTPDADALDLQKPEDFVHALHLPYHRHILAMPALIAAGEKLGWRVVRQYRTMYNNTLVPTMNPRFVLHYVRCHDDVFDLVAEDIRIDSWKLWSPMTLFYAFFGYFFDRHTDIQVIFQKPASPGVQAAAREAS